MQGPVDWIARLLDRLDTPTCKPNKVLRTSISRIHPIRAHTPDLRRMTPLGRFLANHAWRQSDEL